MSITSVVLYFALVYVISSLPGLSGKETSRRGVNRWCKFPSCRPHPHYWILVGFLKGGGCWMGGGFPGKCGVLLSTSTIFDCLESFSFSKCFGTTLVSAFFVICLQNASFFFPGLHTSRNSFLYYSITHFFCGEIGPLQMRLALMLLALQWPLAFTSLRVKEKRCEQERSKGSRRIIFVASFSF